jgi:serine/threonine-protein kinase
MLNQQFGNYKFLSILGEGGMATVYLAENTLLGKKVAVKVLKENFVRNKNRHALFLSIKMLLVNHPNIVKNIDLIDLGDNLALTTEYIEGVTLNDFIRENGPLNILKIENILTQLLSG